MFKLRLILILPLKFGSLREIEREINNHGKLLRQSIIAIVGSNHDKDEVMELQMKFGLGSGMDGTSGEGGCHHKNSGEEDVAACGDLGGNFGGAYWF